MQVDPTGVTILEQIVRDHGLAIGISIFAVFLIFTLLVWLIKVMVIDRNRALEVLAEEMKNLKETVITDKENLTGRIKQQTSIIAELEKDTSVNTKNLLELSSSMKTIVNVLIDREV